MKRLQKIGNVKPLAGNALVVTVIIALVISFISASLVLLAYYNRNAWRQSLIEERLSRNLQSGIHLVLADTVDHYTKTRLTLSLFQKGDDSVMIDRHPWGVYGMALVKASYYERSTTKMLLYGSILPSWLDGCLYLVDHDRSLALVGNSDLTGDAWIPKMGLKQAYIDQRGFARDSLIAGKTYNSEKKSPPLDSAALQYLYGLTDTVGSKQDSILSYSMLKDSLSRSFDDSLLSVKASGMLEIGHTRISGQCMIRSDSVIEVDSDAQVSGALLIAPMIRIRHGFTGALQLMATDSIVLEGNCHLSYPSALVLLRPANQLTQGSIHLGKDCGLVGEILSLSKEQDENKPKTSVVIEEGSVISGLVYVNGFLTLKGSVYGTVLTDYFLDQQGVSLLVNYLVDGTIDHSKLSTFYLGPLLFPGKKTNQVIQWLN